MPLLINKDGQQLGPYSLDEARALVLSGKLEADDWAWPDGAKDWIALKDVPGFAPATTAKPATTPVSPLGEEQLWHGHPSQILNLNTYVVWGIILAATIFICLSGFLPIAWLWDMAIICGVAVVALIHLAVLYFHLRAVEFTVTTQRVRVVSGLFSKDIQELELFRVKDTMVHQTFFLRLFGLGTITVVSGDTSHPKLVLRGIPKAVDLRERMRQEIMVLRQRFGVRELDVM